MSQTLAIAAGGATGALLRFWMSNGIYQWLGRGFPYGTLIVNVLGCLLMGFLFVLFLERLSIDSAMRAGILIGVLGAFTTFSTFSIETLNLIEAREYLKAGLNMGLSLVLCVAATWIGVLLGRQL